jgi:GMP synthase PP-ATPase subunit
MGKFIETMYPKIEDRVNRWETLGMLDTVKSDDSIKLIAMTLDAATIYITNFKPINLDEDTKNILIPVIVKIFNETNNDFTFETLTESVRNIIEDFAEKHKDLKSNLNELSINNNYEVEFISHYCENYSFN